MSERPNVKLVVVHTPGPKWNTGVDFRNQPGIMDHVNHYKLLLEQDQLVWGGPFLEDGCGGMMISKSMSKVELEIFANADPAVRAGLLECKVLSWFVAMNGEPT